jgi:uncharacterized membrane protein YbhN (UPF0104 family)
VTDHPTQQRQLRSGLISAAVLSVLLGGLVLAIPGLDEVAHRVARARPGWVLAGVGLEIASCLGYGLVLQRIFDNVAPRAAMLVALAEQAFGAVVPVGGAGGIAAGGWLLARAGVPVSVIAKRSAVVFLLTSATNVAALIVAGAGLALDVFAGPHDALLSALPAAVGVIVLLLFLGLTSRRFRGHRRDASLGRRAVGATADATVETLRAIRRPGARLAIGAPAYLLCDMAVLWLAMHALGYTVPAAALVLAYLIGYLVNVVPVPGGLGVLDGGLAGALVVYHVPASVALGAVLVYHAIALWIPALSGTAAFLVAHRQIRAGRWVQDSAPCRRADVRPTTRCSHEQLPPEHANCPGSRLVV